MGTRLGDDPAHAASSRQKQATTGRSGHQSELRRQQMRYAILFLAPGLAVYLVFMVYPFLYTIYLSLTNWNGVSETKDFVGLANYTRMLGDGTALKAFSNNVIWVIIGTIAPVAIGLFEALLVWSTSRGSLLFRVLFFLPFVLSLVVVGLVWQWIYHPLYGIINRVLDGVGLEGLSRGWLADPHTALYAVLIAAIWGASGFCFLILHASLQNVDMSTVEAAMIDGANWFQRAWNIIIPQIAPQLTMVTTVTLIGGFSVFDIIVVMTGGGPGHASEVLATYAVKAGFQQNEAGYGSALAMLITALSFVSAILFVRLRERQR
jgi:raffinose/stachyose/melibiose transport system permease protein